MLRRVAEKIQRAPGQGDVFGARELLPDAGGGQGRGGAGKARIALEDGDPAIIAQPGEMPGGGGARQCAADDRDAACPVRHVLRPFHATCEPACNDVKHFHDQTPASPSPLRSLCARLQREGCRQGGNAGLRRRDLRPQGCGRAGCQGRSARAAARSLPGPSAERARAHHPHQRAFGRLRRRRIFSPPAPASPTRS